MRVLRIVEEGAFALELHPYVSVVTGTTPEQRERIQTALVAASRGRTVGVSGLIEAHDVIMDLDESYLGLLDLDDVDLDIVIRAADLPGSTNTGVAKQLQGAEERLRDTETALHRAAENADAADAALEAARDAAADARARADRAHDAAQTGGSRLADLDDQRAAAVTTVESHEPGIAEAEASSAIAAEEQSSAQAALDAANHAVEAAAADVHAAEAAVADARRRRDPFGAAARDTAALALDEVTETVAAERAADAEQHAADADDGESPTERLRRLEAEEERLRSTIETSGAFDPTEVRAALEVYQRGDESSDLVPSAEGLAVADQLDQIERQLASAASAAADSPTPSDHAAAREAVVAAQEALFSAERSSGRPQLDDADVRALEDAHAAVLAAQDKLEGRFGGGARAERRLQEAKEHEAVILKKLQFGTYADYMMGTSILHVDVNSEALAREARDALADAEARLRSIEQQLDGELELAALVNRRQALRTQARAMLGADVTDGDLVSALQQLRVPEDLDFNPLGEIQRALEGVGLVVSGDHFDAHEITDLAEHWLREYYDGEAHREQARVRLTELIGEKADAAAKAAAAEIAATVDPEIDRTARLDAARQRLADAEARVATHAQAETDLRAATERLEHAKLDLAEAHSSVDVATERVRSAAESVATAAGSVERLRHAQAVDAERVARIDADIEALRAEVADADQVDFDDAIAMADADVLHAEAQRSAAQAALTSASSAHRASGDDVAALRAAIADIDRTPPPADEIEWYLLARLAGQRHVSFAGSVPLLLMDALTEVRPEDVEHLMARLERMAGAVQVITITDDPVVTDWARAAGESRVAVVSPLRPRQSATV